MELFSQREGVKSIRTTLQIDSMDADLRNSLWNVLYDYYFILIKNRKYRIMDNDTKQLLEKLWRNHFKRHIDDLRDSLYYPYSDIKRYFLNCEWYEVYDFIEFVINNYDDEDCNLEFIYHCNIALEQERSAYRIVDKQITKMTSEKEIDEIEKALEKAPNLVSIHLNKSLKLLSDRKSPDYSNSIKESISAIESICKLITKKPKGTLGRCLNVIENDVELHPDLKEAFKKLYGYTNDAEGIRHALMEESNLDFEDAKFMLVSCSAFTNYLMAKAVKSDIEL